MKLSVSNIAWAAEHDCEIYEYLSEIGYSGLEIAPTRIFPVTPYEKPVEARHFSDKLGERYQLEISSMQSIWYGVSESLFGLESERRALVEYTKKAIDFAHVVNCGNLVFGCPKNRVIPDGMSSDEYLPVAYDFFRAIGDYAAEKGTCIAIEANPPIYNTNFINTTAQALELCKELNNPGIKVNIDMGTMIHNNENIKLITDNICLVNHVHLSEPHLMPVEKRQVHGELMEALKHVNYAKYLSVEMSNTGDINAVKSAIFYVREIAKGRCENDD